MNDVVTKTDGDLRKSIYRVVIRAPIDIVWAEVVRVDQPLPFFFGAKCETPGLAPGAPIRMRTKSGKYTSVVGDVIAFEPPHLYSHTFRFTTNEDPPCKVTYELKEVAEGVEFTLTSEFPASAEVTETEKSMARGSKFIGDNLKAVVETGKPTFGGGMILALIRLLEPLTPKQCRSENWPL